MHCSQSLSLSVSCLSYLVRTQRAEAKFHVVVERGPLREGSSSWQRAQAAENLAVPAAMVDWVGPIIPSVPLPQEEPAAPTTTEEPVTATS